MSDGSAMTPGLDDKNIELVKRLRETDPGKHSLIAMMAMSEAADAIEDLTKRLDEIWQKYRWT
jgi:hypothetical protein